MNENTFSFTVEKDPTTSTSLLKLQTGHWEINIRLSETELTRLKSLKTHEQSLQAGKSSNSKVFWHIDDQNLIIMVGHDDQSWDFSVTIPLIEAQNFLNSLT